jgi:hemoglobin-like flavoprotein
MTFKRLRLTRDFFNAPNRNIDSIVSITLSNIFEQAPETAAILTSDTSALCGLFSKMLRKVIELTRASYLWPVSAETGHILMPGLNELRARHAAAGVKLEHFSVVKTALFQALEQTCANDFTAEVKDAVSFVFEVLAKSMTEDSDRESEEDPLKKFARLEPINVADFGHHFPMSAE